VPNTKDLSAQSLTITSSSSQVGFQTMFLYKLWCDPSFLLSGMYTLTKVL